MSSPSLWKQALGAVAGATVALVLYGVYDGMKPRLQAYVLPPEVMMKDTRTARRSLPEDTARKFERIANQARASVERFREQQELTSIEEDLLRIGSEVQEGKDNQETEETMKVEESIQEKEMMVEEVVTGDMPIVASVSEPMPVETLPSSGVAMSLSAIGALVGAAVLRRKKAKRA